METLYKKILGWLLLLNLMPLACMLISCKDDKYTLLIGYLSGIIVDIGLIVIAGIIGILIWCFED